MALSKLLLLLFTFLTLACSKPKVLDQHSVWTLSRADAVANEDFRMIKVRFRDNGYAYETNTILKYPYRIHSTQNIFEFNRKITESSRGKTAKLCCKTAPPMWSLYFDGNRVVFFKGYISGIITRKQLGTDFAEQQQIQLQHI